MEGKVRGGMCQRLRWVGGELGLAWWGKRGGAGSFTPLFFYDNKIFLRRRFFNP